MWGDRSGVEEGHEGLHAVCPEQLRRGQPPGASPVTAGQRRRQPGPDRRGRWARGRASHWLLGRLFSVLCFESPRPRRRPETLAGNAGAANACAPAGGGRGRPLAKAKPATRLPTTSCAPHAAGGREGYGGGGGGGRRQPVGRWNRACAWPVWRPSSEEGSSAGRSQSTAARCCMRGRPMHGPAFGTWLTARAPVC